MRRAITSFRGMAPRVTPRALPDNAAQDATNARLLTGDLTAWRQFALTQALANGGPVRTIYRLNGAWLEWEEDVDVARGIIPGDTTFRVYLTGLDVPRFTNYALATTGSPPYPVTTRPLGVPAPNSVPSIALGIDPTPTTFSVDVTDDGDELETSWITSPYFTSPNVATSEVTQVATQGNPTQPSYQLFWDRTTAPAVPTFAARNFGVANARVVEFTSDWRVGDNNGRSRAEWGILRDLGGSGLVVAVDRNTNWTVSVGVASSWAQYGSMASTSGALAGLSANAWFRMHIQVVVNADNSVSITATVRTTADVDIGSTTATVQAARGDYCGFSSTFAPLPAIGSYAWFDNIRVQASGSLDVTIVNLATSYVFTFVNDLGEQSAPSLPSVTVVRPDGLSATITTATSLPTGVSATYGIATKRIYRAASGNTGTVFRFVAEIPLAQADYVDTLTDAELGELLESELWALPPDDLRGILALPNGVMVGFRRNQLCFSAQNNPHAWPIEYRLNTDTDIVGIGNVDTTVVIGTESFVYLASGNDPAAYSMSKLESPQASVSKNSFDYLVGIGVAFASPDGLMSVTGPGQIRNLLETVFTREQWQALNPESMHSVSHNDIYFLFWEAGSARGCYAIDMKPTGFGVVVMAFHACAAYVDPLTDKMYLVLDSDDEPDDPDLPIPASPPAGVNGATIFEFEGHPTELMTYRYRSKLWLLEHPATMQVTQVEAEDFDNLILRAYGDGTLVDEVLVAEGTEFVMADADVYASLELEIVGTSTVRTVQAAEDVGELD